MHESIINILKEKGFQELNSSQEPFFCEYQNERIAVVLFTKDIKVFVKMAQGEELSGTWQYDTNFEKNINALLTMTKSL